MAAEQIRIEVGLDGGQALSMLVENGAADELEQAIATAEPRAGAGEGAVTLEAEDGRYTLALRRIVYVKRYRRESRVGFGT
jgi:hypothetical protein